MAQRPGSAPSPAASRDYQPGPQLSPQLATTGWGGGGGQRQPLSSSADRQVSQASPLAPAGPSQVQSHCSCPCPTPTWDQLPRETGEIPRQDPEPSPYKAEGTFGECTGQPAWGETEAQGGGATFPRSHPQSVLEPRPESRLRAPFSLTQSTCFRRERLARRLEGQPGAAGVGGQAGQKTGEGEGAVPVFVREASRPRSQRPQDGARDPGFRGSPRPPEEDGRVTGLVTGRGRWQLWFLFLSRCESPEPSQFRRKEECGAEAPLGVGGQGPTSSGTRPWARRTLLSRGSALGSGVTAPSGQTWLGMLGSWASVPTLALPRDSRPRCPGAGTPEPPRGGPRASNLLSYVQIPALSPPGCATLRSCFTSLVQ